MCVRVCALNEQGAIRANFLRENRRKTCFFFPFLHSDGEKRRDGYFNVSKGGGSLRERGLIFIEEAPGGGKFSPNSFHEIHLVPLFPL